MLLIDYVLCIYVLHAASLMSLQSTQLMLNSNRLSVDSTATVQVVVSPPVDRTMELMTVVWVTDIWVQLLLHKYLMLQA